MIYMSLDLSSKSSGVAVYDTEIKENQGLLYYTCIASTSTDLLKRVTVMRDGITAVLNLYPKIEKVVLEEVLPEKAKGNQKTHRALMYVQAAIAIAIWEFNKKIELDFIYPSSWRSKIGIATGRGIKREELKAKDIQYVKECFGIETKNDDICDAILIGLAYQKEKKPDYNWA